MNIKTIQAQIKKKNDKFQKDLSATLTYFKKTIAKNDKAIKQGDTS